MADPKVNSVKFLCRFFSILALLSFPQTVLAQSVSQSVPLNPTRIPEQILEQTIPAVTPPPITPSNDQPQLDSAQIKNVVRFAVSTTSVRYPYLVNPSDRVTFSPNIFDPGRAENYLDVDIRVAAQNPVVAKLTYGSFPRSQQFYWVLPNNEVVIETQGVQAGILQVGKGRDLTIKVRSTRTRALSGTQTVTALPEFFSSISKGQDPTKFTVQSTAAQVINPPGTLAVPIVLNTGIDLNNPNVTIINSDVATTNSSQGGASNFGNLEPINTPQVIQGFPTVNLQGLFSNGEIPLTEGSILPEANLKALGLSFDTPSTNNNTLGGLTSFAGIKTLQRNQFDNLDLLEVLSNPSLKGAELEYHYLNSLFWSDLGIRAPVLKTQRTETSSSWQRFYIDRPVNQTVIRYAAKSVEATYASRFVNLGFSLSYSLDAERINWGQSFNDTLGMLLGGIFLATDPEGLQAKVDEAKKLKDEKAKFTPLSTISTSEQRQQINQRLNTTLFYNSIVSGLEQVSGSLSIASQITPKDSNLFQVRTGLYRRAVQFIGREIDPVIVGDNVVSRLRGSVNKFGPLTFIGTQIPRDLTGLAANESFASEVVLTAPNGQQFVQSFNSSDPKFSALPAGINREALAFDRIEITRTDQQTTRFFTYLGYISLPSVEFVWSGSKEGLNYGVSTGLWFNLFPDTAGNVANNNLGTPEPSVGAYVNGILSWSKSFFHKDKNNRIRSVTTFSPVLRLAWNSDSTTNNASTVNLSFTLQHQIPGLTLSITPGFLLAAENSNMSTMRDVEFLQGTVEIANGFKVKTSLEYDQKLFWTVEASQKLNQNWTIGAFYKNFREFNLGLDTRDISLNFGLLTKYQIRQSPVVLEAQLGRSDGDIEFRIKGSSRF
jgi:hypothetical protein